MHAMLRVQTIAEFSELGAARPFRIKLSFQGFKDRPINIAVAINCNRNGA
jgi:hypothetical protein